MIRQLFIWVILMMAAPVVSTAQYSEIGITGGVNYYIGDINPNKHFYGFKPAGGILVKINTTDRHAFKFNLNIGSVEAYDADSDIDFNINRNLSFRSSIVEFGAMLELNFFPYEIGNSQKSFTPYIFFGLSAFTMKPEAQLNHNGSWYELQPLGTEGQGIDGYASPYALTVFALPFGMGFKANIIGRFACGIEWGFRKTFTDYLDDVSGIYADPIELEEQNGPLAAQLADQRLGGPTFDETNVGYQRGDKNKQDWYVYSGLTLSVRIGNTRIKCPSPRN